jgi:hypothetical protein
MKDGASLGASSFAKGHRLYAAADGGMLLALCHDHKTAQALHSALVDREWAIQFLQVVLKYGRGEVPADIMDDIRRAVQSMEARES